MAEDLIDLPAAIAKRLTGRSMFLVQGSQMTFVQPSLRHGRSLSACMPDGRWLSIKGCGWNWGPPWIWHSPKDPELCFGLLDGLSAQRAVAVSTWLHRHDVDCSRSEQCIELNAEELALLGINSEIRFINNQRIVPSALLTLSSTPYRVADLNCETREAALTEMRRVLGTGESELLLQRLACRLTTTVARYQTLGAVNDTLNPENVTVAGEVTDFEWFYVPGIPTPDGSRDEQLMARQHKEAIYLIEVLIVAASALGLSLSVCEAAGLSLASVSPEARAAPVLSQMREISRQSRLNF